MSAKQFQSRILAAGLFLAGSLGAFAVTITNVTPVNVSPSSFGVFWRSGSGFSPSIQVFADPAAASNITPQLSVKLTPIHTGNPDDAAGYYRRQSEIALQQKAQSLSLSLVTVSGCKPGTTYYFRLASTPDAGAAVVYPTNTPLPSVTTGRDNVFVINDQPLILDVPGVDTYGRVVLLSHTNSPYPLAAVVGDGAGTNQAFFNFTDLLTLSGGTNFMPTGAQTFDVTSLGLRGDEESAQFSLAFSQAFGTGQAGRLSFGTEFLQLVFGSAVVQTGQSTNVPITFNSSVNISTLDVTLNVPSARFTNLSLTALAPEVDAATVSVTIQNASNIVLHLPALSGQVLTGEKALASLTFTAAPGQHSAFVPVHAGAVSAAKPGSSLVTNLNVTPGRVVIVGTESLLESAPSSGDLRSLTLYANPMRAYAIESTASLSTNSVWTRSRPLAITELVTTVHIPADPSGASTFYRAVEYNPDPSYVDAIRNPDGSRSLRLFGKPGSKYAIQTSSSIAPAHWTTVTNVTLTAPFQSYSIGGQGSLFYRAGETP